MRNIFRVRRFFQNIFRAFRRGKYRENLRTRKIFPYCTRLRVITCLSPSKKITFHKDLEFWRLHKVTLDCLRYNATASFATLYCPRGQYEIYCPPLSQSDCVYFLRWTILNIKLLAYKAVANSPILSFRNFEMKPPKTIKFVFEWMECLYQPLIQLLGEKEYWWRK